MTDTQSPPVTAEGRLKDVKTFFDHGEFFRAYDLAAEALELFPGDVVLAHRAVLSLANAGATALALSKYYEFGLDKQPDTDARSLLGRLKKDQAFAETGEARAALFREGRALYEDAFRTATAADDPEAYYPAINAATLALFAGDAEAAGRLAGEVLDLLAPRIASLDERCARPLLGVGDGARGPSRTGRSRRGAWAGRPGRRGSRPRLRRTRHHRPAARAHRRGEEARFQRACRVQAADRRPLPRPYDRAPPEGGSGVQATVAADIAALLEGMRIGAAYGSLAAGADILFAEALLEQGVALNVVLPFATADFIEQSVRPAGEDWVTRFEACLAAAKTVRFATEDAYLGDDQLFAYSSSLAMGLASLCARHLHAPLMQLAVWDGPSNR